MIDSMPIIYGIVQLTDTHGAKFSSRLGLKNFAKFLNIDIGGMKYDFPQDPVATPRHYFILLEQADSAFLGLIQRAQGDHFVLAENGELGALAEKGGGYVHAVPLPEPQELMIIVCDIPIQAAKVSFPSIGDKSTLNGEFEKKMIVAQIREASAPDELTFRPGKRYGFSIDNCERYIVHTVLSVERDDNKVFSFLNQAFRYNLFDLDDAKLFFKKIQYIGEDPEIMHLEQVEWVINYRIERNFVSALLIQRLYEKYHGVMPKWKSFRGLNRELVKDLIQESYLEILKEMPKGDIQEIPRLLYTIAKTKVIDHWRKIYAERAKIYGYADTLDPSAAVYQDEYQPDISELKKALEVALSVLDKKHQDVLRLVYLEGVSIETAAKRLGCSPGTVKSRLFRGREKLKENTELKGLFKELF